MEWSDSDDGRTGTSNKSPRRFTSDPDSTCNRISYHPLLFSGPVGRRRPETRQRREPSQSLIIIVPRQGLLTRDLQGQEKENLLFHSMFKYFTERRGSSVLSTTYPKDGVLSRWT